MLSLILLLEVVGASYQIIVLSIIYDVISTMEDITDNEDATAMCSWSFSVCVNWILMAYTVAYRIAWSLPLSFFCVFHWMRMYMLMKTCPHLCLPADDTSRPTLKRHYTWSHQNGSIWMVMYLLFIAFYNIRNAVFASWVAPGLLLAIGSSTTLLCAVYAL